MIWFRRILTLPLILIFTVLTIAAAVVSAANGTVANPGFYNDRMVQADVYNFIYDSVLPAALDEIDTGEGSDAPIDIAGFRNEILAVAEQVLPAWWLQQQFESITNILIPYMVDNKPSFSYTLIVKDRVDAAGDAIKDKILAGSTLLDIYDDLLSYIAGYYYENLPALPPGVDITRNEIEFALKDSLTPQWLKIQLDVAVDQLIPYLSGDRNYFELNIRIQERVSDETLLTLLGPGNEAYLDEARDWIGEGWTYTQIDLYADLSAENVQTLQDVRGWIHNGYTFTHIDLCDAMFDNPQDAEAFDDIRHWISVGRTWMWVLWVVPFLLLAGIGFLGGRGWKTRAAGPLVILLIVSLAMFLAVMLTWGQWGEPEMRNALPNPSEYQGVESVMWEKVGEIALDAAGSFVNSLQNIYMYMLIASAVGLIGVGVWWLIGSRSKKDAT